MAKAPSGNCNYDGFMNDYAVFFFFFSLSLSFSFSFLFSQPEKQVMIAKGVNRAGKQVDDVSCPAVLSTVSSDVFLSFSSFFSFFSSLFFSSLSLFISFFSLLSKFYKQLLTTIDVSCTEKTLNGTSVQFFSE